MSNNDTGFLSMIIGPMYSGKTSYLIDLYKKLQLSNISTFVINYSEDTRYGNNVISTHDSIKIPCSMSLDLTSIITQDVIKNHKVFLINEGQFFDDLYEVVTKLINNYDKHVYIAALSSDFKQSSFPQISQIMSQSDEIILKKAICGVCKNGTKATFTHRLTSEKSIKVIGTNAYVPVCRKCYNKLNTH